MASPLLFVSARCNAFVHTSLLCSATAIPVFNLANLPVCIIVFATSANNACFAYYFLCSGMVKFDLIP